MNFVHLENSNGEYALSFFSVHIDTEDSDIEEIKKKYTSTFVHEFLHYLQDLVLPYNIRTNLSNIAYFYNIIECTQSKKIIERPFKEFDFNTRTLWEQSSWTLGQKGSDGFVENVTAIRDIKMSYLDQKCIDHSKNFVTRRLYKYEIETDQVLSYQFGARDFLEYIAYKIEAKHFPSEKNSFTFPYCTIDAIFDHYGLSSIDEDIKICIAEACLYNDNPAHNLMSSFLSRKDVLLNSRYEHIYPFLYNSIFITPDGTPGESLLSKRARRLDDFKQFLGDNYKSFSDIVQWIETVNSFVRDKLPDQFIFSYMYRLSTDAFLDFVNDTILEIGIPMVLNKHEIYSSSRPKECTENHTNQFVNFYIMEKYLNGLLYDNKSFLSCPILKFCKANFDCHTCSCTQIYDLRRKKLKNLENCPLREFLEIYGLDEATYQCR